MIVKKVFGCGIVVGLIVGSLTGIVLGAFCTSNSTLINGGVPKNPSYIMYQDNCPLCGQLRESDYSYSTGEGTHTCDSCGYTINFN